MENYPKESTIYYTFTFHCEMSPFRLFTHFVLAIISIITYHFSAHHTPRGIMTPSLSHPHLAVLN